ncbi:MAG: amino acid permease, partial [Phycisphaerae bacterium]|nr:amino acid permease [Phycisphaerae bacterium]
MTKQDLPRSIGVWGGAAIMVGVMIGTGIFRTPTIMAREMDSPMLILLLWVVGGGLCLLGAFTFAELATLYPRSGGLYVYLREGLGDCPAFVFGWTYLLLTQPMALAALATVFAEHLLLLLGVKTDVWLVSAVTCVTILLLTGLNVTGMKRGAGVAVLLTGFKTLALAAIVGAAVILMKGDAAHFAALPVSRPFLAALAPAMIAIFWAYDGWSDVSAVAEEVREPQRLIPRIFLIGTVGITALYVAVNAVYFWLVPLEEMRTTNTVAPLVMSRLLGPAAGTVVTVMIMVSVLGCTHASAIVGSRVMFAQARDRLLFSFLGRVHSRFQTPSSALWAQAVLACVASIGLRHFERLIGGFVFTLWIFYGLAAVSIFTLRVRRPDLPRPFRCWGYPVVPAVFI